MFLRFVLSFFHLFHFLGWSFLLFFHKFRLLHNKSSLVLWLASARPTFPPHSCVRNYELQLSSSYPGKPFIIDDFLQFIFTISLFHYLSYHFFLSRILRRLVFLVLPWTPTRTFTNAHVDELLGWKLPLERVLYWHYSFSLSLSSFFCFLLCLKSRSYFFLLNYFCIKIRCAEEGVTALPSQKSAVDLWSDSTPAEEFQVMSSWQNRTSVFPREGECHTVDGGWGQLLCRKN